MGTEGTVQTNHHLGDTMIGKSNKRTGALLHTVLLASVSTLAIGMSASPGHAQGDNAASGTTESVVVTSTRASLQTSQSIKQESDQIVDSITAVDIGALPDRTVADALQRVPGVTLIRTDQINDPVRYGGTGNGIYIRGLSYVQSLTNGRDVFSASNGRSLSFADVSADLLSGIDVYKNPDAKMIEGGVGGTINLKTRKPFDHDSLLMAFSGDYTYGDLINKGSPTATGLISDRWNTGIGEIGALLSIDYQEQQNRTNGYSLSHFDCVSATGLNADGTSSGASVFGDASCGKINSADRRYIPGIFDARQIDWKQTRLAVDSSAQWRSPNGEWEATVEAFYSKADPHDTEFSLPFNVPQGFPNPNVNYTYDSKGVWTGGTINNAQTGGVDTRIGRHENLNGDYSLNVQFHPSEAWSFSADAQYSESRGTNYSMTGFTDMGNPNDSQTPGVPGENVTIVDKGYVPTLSISNPSAMRQESNYYYAAAMDHLEDNFAHAWTYRADGTYKFQDDNGWIKSVDFGFRGEQKQAITRQTGYGWSILSHQNWGGGPPVFLGQTGGLGPAGSDGATPDPNLPKTVALKNFGSFFGTAGPQAWFFAPSALDGNTQDVYAALKASKTNGGFGWTPYATQAQCPAHMDVKCLAAYGTTTPSANFLLGGINTHSEIITSGYVQINYAHDNFLGTGVPVDGNIGVRIVTTEDNIGAGQLALPTFSSGCIPDPRTNCTDFFNALSFTGAGGTTATPAVTNTYTKFLPSFNFTAHFTDQLQGRLAFSQGMVRPDFGHMTNYTSLGFNFGPTQAAPLPNLNGTFYGATPQNGSGGNPNLKPLLSNNYDASLEWYFAPTGSLTLGLFHKDISNYFVSGLVPFTMTRNGIPYTFQMTSYLNGNKGKIEGFELGYQQFFDTLPGFLSGFGVAANYTKIYNSGGSSTPGVPNPDPTAVALSAGLPLEGMSPDSYNVQLMYEKYGISTRLAYNWRSRFLLTSSAANVNQPVWSENYGQLDGSIFYNFLDHYKAGIQATNLLNQTTFLDAGYVNFHPRYDYIQTDRKVSFILRAQW